MDLYPAIDLRGGRCVRLVEGDFAQETVYGDDPVAVAESFTAAGAKWIHVVDLDAARTGDPVNRPVVAAVAAAVAGWAGATGAAASGAGVGAAGSGPGVRVQTGGGVRSLDDVAYLVEEAGVARVVIGTAAVEHPELVVEAAARWPGHVAVGLDHRGGEVRLRGWMEGAGKPVDELVPAAVEAGASAVIVTDISRDGRMAGPDIDGLSALAVATGAPLIASGGVSGLDDVVALSQVPGLIGVIAGKAIYEGALDVAAGIEALAGAARPGQAQPGPTGR